MNHLLRFTLTFVLLTGVVAGQKTPAEIDAARMAARAELRPLCERARETDRSEEELLKNLHSAAVDRALLSEEDFWKFITSPSTSYLDRMLAANKGGALISPKELPRFWSAVAAFEHAPTGVFASPCDYLMSSNRWPEQWTTRRDGHIGFTFESRTILGHLVDLPAMTFDYPITPELRDGSPWLWQMSQALPILKKQVDIYYSQPDRYPAMAAAAWEWRTSDFYETRIKDWALLEGPRDAEWVDRAVRVALEESDVSLAAGAPADLYVWGYDSYHFEELVNTGLIVILQRTHKKEVAAAAAERMLRMTTDQVVDPGLSPDRKPLKTATGVLAASRSALDPRMVPSWRVAIAGYVCKMVDNPPFKLNDRYSAAETTNNLSQFEKWFSTQRERLERDAAAEHQHLNSLAAEIHENVY